MKKIIFFIVICSALITFAAPVFAGSERLKVPRVAYQAPDNQTVVDLTGKNSLAFQWKSTPIPGGGRHAYRFKVYKGFSYETVTSQDLGQDVFSVEVPADKFDDGATYSWTVQQRDASNMLWSLNDTWSFKVIKKK